MSRITTLTSLAGALTLGVFIAVSAQSNAPPERFSANAVNLDRGVITPLQIVIDRWSSDAERDRLMSVVMDRGANALLETLQKAPKVGYIRTTTSLGWDLHFARRQTGKDGGERIVLATDRPMSFWETVNQPRRADYPFTIIEMRINNEGEGEGMLSYATKIIPDEEGRTLTLENYGTQPERLTQVKRERPSQH